MLFNKTLKGVLFGIGIFVLVACSQKSALAKKPSDSCLPNEILVSRVDEEIIICRNPVPIRFSEGLKIIDQLNLYRWKHLPKGGYNLSDLISISFYQYDLRIVTVAESDGCNAMGLNCSLRTIAFSLKGRQFDEWGSHSTADLEMLNRNSQNITNLLDAGYAFPPEKLRF
jgi:hypothetical protein